MIAFIFAWLLAMLSGHPAPSAPAPAPAPHVVVRAGGTRTPGHHPGALSSPRIGGTSPSPRPATPTVPAGPTYFPETLRTPAWPTVTPPPTDGPELEGPRMCTDPVYCPTS